MDLDLLKHWDRLYSALIRDQHAKNIFDREKLKNQIKKIVTPFVDILTTSTRHLP